MDGTGTIEHINHSFETIYGYSKEDLVGKYFDILFTEEDRKKGLPELEVATALEHGTALDDNYIVHKSGKHIWVSGESIHTSNAKGKSFLIKIIHNIEEKKALEDKLKERNDELKMIINDRNNFIYAASHDLIVPINNIEGLSKHLAILCKDDSQSLFILNMMTESIDRFRKTLITLSAIGNLEEEAKMNVSDIDMKQLFEEIISDLQPDIIAQKGIVNHDFSEVPIISFSLKNLRSILLNLISNSLKYAHPDRVPNIFVKTQRLNGFVLLSVKDNGIGIKEEDKEMVFQMYKRALKSEAHGTGVGLALLKRIVDNVGGKVEVESEPDHGSIFKIYLKQ